MSAQIPENALDTQTFVSPNGGEFLSRKKSDAEIAVEMGDTFVKRTAKAAGRVAGLVSEMTEAEAVCEILDAKFRATHIKMLEESEAWLKEFRMAKYAMEAETRGAIKVLADMTEILGKPEIKESVARAKELCDVVERLAALNSDGRTQRLIDALLPHL